MVTLLYTEHRARSISCPFAVVLHFRSSANHVSVCIYILSYIFYFLYQYPSPLCSLLFTKVCSAAVSMEGFVPMLLQSGSKDSTDFSAFRKTIIISSRFILKIF